MEKIAISKTEYSRLKSQAAAYKRFASHLFEAVIRDPIQTVVEDFRKTNLYTNEFLGDLEEGLKKSSYGNQ